VIRLPERAALFLDLDGTLIDLAPTPDSVVVPPELPTLLRALHHRLDGALAIVTGRPIAQVDALLPGIPFAVAGEHGGAIRPTPDAEILRAPSEPVPLAFLDAAETLVARHPGAILERKARGYVLHFRRAPEAGPVFEQHLRTTLQNWPHHRISAAHMAWEIKPQGIDKGVAVATLMASAPFAGRVPVFIGDDVTDEDGMRAARQFGGIGLRVQEAFGDPAGVRKWLEEVLF
jgi:trehalose 6-phosphate phosphatase